MNGLPMPFQDFGENRLRPEKVSAEEFPAPGIRQHLLQRVHKSALDGAIEIPDVVHIGGGGGQQIAYGVNY